MLDNGSAPVFTNCILYNNLATVDGDEVAMNTNAGDPDFYYCNVSGGTAGFGGWGANDYNGNYENNLDADPRFTGSGDHPYNIQVSSPCLNTGKQDLSGLYLPELDLAGNPRIAQGCEERIDMGAYENQSQATTSFGGTLDQDAHWCADTVTITGDVTVSNGVSLTIGKGTVVYIAGDYSMDIKGNIVAIGEENDSVVFTTNSIWPYWWWRGIILHNLQAANDSSIFRYCRFSVSGLDNGTGGAMSIDNWDKVEISDCRFSNNNAYSKGGALAIQNTSITLTSCLISNNEGFYGGGLYAYNANISIINCTFLSNSTQSSNCDKDPAEGGAIYLENCTGNIMNCTIQNNEAGYYGGGIISKGGTLELIDNDISYNQAYAGGGLYLSGTGGHLTGNTINHNTGTGGSGGLQIRSASPTLSKNQISHNYAPYVAGIELHNCNSTFTNNLIAENHAGTAGGGMRFFSSSPTFINNTFYKNHADNFAGCLHFGGSSNSNPIFRNCIFYDNYVISYDGNNVFMYDDSGQPNFYYCDLEGGTAGFGGYYNNYTGDYENNIDADPQFTDSGNYPQQLQQDSPCLNTGDASTDTTDVGTTDMAGNPRIQNGRIDMGCYENETSSDSYAGGAVLFSDADDLITLDNENHFDFDDSFTVEFWMYCNEMTEDNHLLIKKGDAWAMNLFYSPAIALLDFSVDSNGVFGYVQTTGTALLNKWNHVAGVCKKREFGGFDITIYLNGVKGTEDIESNLTHNNKPVTIGNDFLGKIDELRVWNKALSEQEIRENMHLVINPITDRLVCYHQFNRDSDDILVDIAGGNNGKLQNMSAGECFVSSSVPAGGGMSSTQTEATGMVLFTGTGLSMDFTSHTGASITVSRIDTTPNLSPSLFDEQYWIVERYGSGSFSANLTFDVAEDIAEADASSPSQIKLYTRDSNADTYWSYSLSAASVDADNDRVVFDDITSFSQFAVCRRLAPNQEAGNMLKFDGELDYVEGAGISHTLKAFTIEAWVFHNSLPQEVQRYVSIYPEAAVIRYDGSTYGGSDELHFYISDTDSNHHSIRANGVLQTGVWQHIAGTYDGNDMKLYHNGELVNSISPGKELLSPSGNFLFSHVTETLDGRLDEVRLWNYARDIDDIRSDMYRTLPNTTGRGMVAYWQLNEVTGSQVSELTGEHTGTLHHMDESSWDASTAPVPFQSAADGGWSATATWASGQGVPHKDWSRVQINNYVVLDQDETLADLSVQASSSLTVSSTNYLTVTESLTNGNGNSGLVLKSDAAGTASLIHKSEGVNATAQCYIPKYETDATGWHYLSSPMVQQAIRPEFVASPPEPDEDFYKFSEQQYIWINVKDNSGNWDPTFEDNFVVGRGYNVAYAVDVTKSFEGELNTADFTFDGTTTPAITYTESGGIGWNLMGNPYPSGLDWDECSRTNIDGSVYVFDGNAGQYLSWNGTVGGLDDGVIPPMNGFFIKASENPSLNISNDARAHTSTSFLKSKESVQELLVLKVEGNGFSDQTYIHFNPDATQGFDHDFDAYKLSGIEAAPQLYTKTGDTRLSINELPYSNEEIAIPLSLKIGKDGQYTISVAQNTFWETVDISLKDLQTQITYDLRTTTQLTVNHSTTNSPDRFLLLINGATGIEENLPEDDGIEIYSYGNQVFVKTDMPGEAKVGIYNMLGQQVLQRNLSGFQNLTGLEIHPTGFYLVTIRTEKAMVTEKVFIR